MAFSKAYYIDISSGFIQTMQFVKKQHNLTLKARILSVNDLIGQRVYRYNNPNMSVFM